MDVCSIVQSTLPRSLGEGTKTREMEKTEKRDDRAMLDAELFGNNFDMTKAAVAGQCPRQGFPERLVGFPVDIATSSQAVTLYLLTYPPTCRLPVARFERTRGGFRRHHPSCRFGKPWWRSWCAAEAQVCSRNQLRSSDYRTVVHATGSRLPPFTSSSSPVARVNRGSRSYSFKSTP